MALKLRKNRAATQPETCNVGACMQVLGGAWTPNVIWFLSGGPRRFGELRRDMPVISAKMLSARLRALEEKGVVQRKVVPTTPPSTEYALTELGQEYVPAILAIAEVGAKLKAQAVARAQAQAA
ncbi:winged helix-turn-helix transcriptional regulator [Bosea sp. NPDC055332]